MEIHSLLILLLLYCSTSYIQEASISQGINIIWFLNSARLPLAGRKWFCHTAGKSEISKMLSVKQKCWPLHGDRKAVANVWFSVLLCHHCGRGTESEKRQIRDVCMSVCVCGLFAAILHSQPHLLQPHLAPLLGSHLHFLLVCLDSCRMY